MVAAPVAVKESRQSASSTCNPATAATKAEDQKSNNFRDDLIIDAYNFQPTAFEAQCATGPSTENFLNKFCKNLTSCTEESRASSFFKQRNSLAMQVANAACVYGTIRGKIVFKKITYRAKGTKALLYLII